VPSIARGFFRGVASDRQRTPFWYGILFDSTDPSSLACFAGLSSGELSTVLTAGGFISKKGEFRGDAFKNFLEEDSTLNSIKLQRFTMKHMKPVKQYFICFSLPKEGDLLQPQTYQTATKQQFEPSITTNRSDAIFAGLFRQEADDVDSAEPCGARATSASSSRGGSA